MATYTIIRVYQVPADNRLQATDRMLEALTRQRAVCGWFGCCERSLTEVDGSKQACLNVSIRPASLRGRKEVMCV